MRGCRMSEPHVAVRSLFYGSIGPELERRRNRGKREQLSKVPAGLAIRPRSLDSSAAFWHKPPLFRSTFDGQPHGHTRRIVRRAQVGKVEPMRRILWAWLATQAVTACGCMSGPP